MVQFSRELSHIFLSALCNELDLINYASLKSYIGAMHVAYETTWGVCKGEWNDETTWGVQYGS